MTRAIADVAVGVLDYMLRELDHGRRRVRREPGRRHRRGRRPDVHVARAGDPRGPRRRRAGVHRRLRRHRRRQLGGRDDPVPGLAGDRSRRRGEAGLRLGSRTPARGCWTGAPTGRSRRATTRRSPPGTGWPSRPSPTPAACSGRSGTRPPPSAAADAILGGLLAADGSLGRSWKDGRAVGQGVLEDYAHLADGLLALYEATFDERWFMTARGLMDRVLDRFADPAGGFFDTADDHERLITRPKDPQDNAVPSGGAMAATVLLRLAALDRGGALSRGRGTGDRHGRAVPRRATRRGSPSGSSAATVRGRRTRSRWPSSATPTNRPRRACSPPPRLGGGRTRSWPRPPPRRPPRVGRPAARTTASPSTAARPPTSAAASSATCRSPTRPTAPARSERQLTAG